LRRVALGERSEPALAASAALIASAALAEADKYSSAVRLLDRTALTIQDKSIGPEHALLLATLVLGRAARLVQLGRFTDAEEALAVSAGHLERVDSQAIGTFEVSAGVAWDSEAVVDRVIAELGGAIQGLRLGATSWDSRPSREWQDLVRNPAPRLSLETARLRSDGLKSYVDRLFEQSIDPDYGGMRFQSEDPVGQPLYSAMIHDDVVGDVVGGRRTREVIGKIRASGSWAEYGLVDARSAGATSEALRLLRQSRDRGSFKSLVRDVRAFGPLTALRDEALHVLSNRNDLAADREPLMLLIGSAADLLDEADAARAFRYCMRFLDPRYGGYPTPGGEWHAARVEYALRALVQVANRQVGAWQVISDWALKAVRADWAVAKDSSFGLNLVIEQMDWRHVASESLSAWRSWLEEQPEGSDLGGKVRESLAEFDIANLASVDGQVNVGDVGPYRLVSAVLRGLLPAASLTELGLNDGVRQELEAKAKAARSGAYFLGSDDPGWLAAAICLTGTADPLLKRALVEFLGSAEVARSDKQSALALFTSLAQDVPIDLRDSLAEVWDGIWDSHPSSFGSTGRYFGVGIAAGWALDLASQDELARHTADALAAGIGERVRVARALGRLRPAALVDSAWLKHVVLSLARDSAPRVATEVCQAVGRLCGVSSDLTVDALGAEMLSRPGLSMPGYFIAGLRDVLPSRPNPALLPSIDSLGESSISWSVRRSAVAYGEMYRSTLPAS
jgi:hypothetical protein